MKTQQIAFCLIRKNSRKYSRNRFSPVIHDGRMPIYWNKKVAKKAAEESGTEVLKVVVLPAPHH